LLFAVSTTYTPSALPEPSLGRISPLSAFCATPSEKNPATCHAPDRETFLSVQMTVISWPCARTSFRVTSSCWPFSEVVRLPMDPSGPTVVCPGPDWTTGDGSAVLVGASGVLPLQPATSNVSAVAAAARGNHPATCASPVLHVVPLAR
jgi:hypothetical protein